MCPLAQCTLPWPRCWMWPQPWAKPPFLPATMAVRKPQPQHQFSDGYHSSSFFSSIARTPCWQVWAMWVQVSRSLWEGAFVFWQNKFRVKKSKRFVLFFLGWKVKAVIKGKNWGEKKKWSLSLAGFIFSTSSSFLISLLLDGSLLMLQRSVSSQLFRPISCCCPLQGFAVYLTLSF